MRARGIVRWASVWRATCHQYACWRQVSREGGRERDRERERERQERLREDEEESKRVCVCTRLQIGAFLASCILSARVLVLGLVLFGSFHNISFVMCRPALSSY